MRINHGLDKNDLPKTKILSRSKNGRYKDYVCLAKDILLQRNH